MTGILVTFEGLEKSGKSTQIRLLKHFLEQQNVSVITGREPGGTAYGEAARRMIQDPKFIERINDAYKSDINMQHLDEDDELSEAGELFGYLLARSMFIEQNVAPALKKGIVFLADRLGDSTVAYQGYGNWNADKEKIAFINTCNAFCYGDTQITRTYLLDIPAQESEVRKGDDEFGTGKDRIEQRNFAYFEKVRKGYLELAKQEPERYKVIDGTLSPQQVQQIIEDDIMELLQ